MATHALHVVSEVFPLAKTGGLADVCAALPAALGAIGVDARLVIPAYPQAVERAIAPREIARLRGLLGLSEIGVLSARLPRSDVPVWLLDCPALYDRDGGIYQDESGQEWPDNALRFGLLAHVAALLADGLDGAWRADVVHAHDWHAGLVPLLLARHRNGRPASLMTIHNLAYQGLFEAAEYGKLGLPDDRESYSSMEFYGRISFLKAGINWADAITTVSPRYSREILTPEYGCGLDGLLRSKSERLFGVMNGADYDAWNPEQDAHLPATYGVDQTAGKATCKAAFQNAVGFSNAPQAPLIAFVSRLAHQKMPDVVAEALPTLLGHGIQFAVVAEGEAEYANRFRELSKRHPQQVFVQIGYKEPLAHRLIAGADMLLHPSRYEPCGLTPIYAMRYGTIPIVRCCGGLADSVTDVQSGADPYTGFCFMEPVLHDLLETTLRAVSAFRQPDLWHRIRLNAMRQNFGWSRSASTYGALYRKLVNGNSIGEAEAKRRRAS